MYFRTDAIYHQVDELMVWSLLDANRCLKIMFIYIISNAGIFRADDDVITFQTGTLKYADTYVHIYLPQMVFICNFKI